MGSKTGSRPRAKKREPCHHGALPTRPTAVHPPPCPAHLGDAQGNSTRCHLLIVIVETICWLLVLAVHPTLFAARNKSKAQHHIKQLTKQTQGSNDGTTATGVSYTTRGTRYMLDGLSRSSCSLPFQGRPSLDGGEETEA